MSREVSFENNYFIHSDEVNDFEVADSDNAKENLDDLGERSEIEINRSESSDEKRDESVEDENIFLSYKSMKMLYVL